MRLGTALPVWAALVVSLLAAWGCAPHPQPSNARVGESPQVSGGAIREDVTFSFAGETWSSHKHFVESGGRCATQDPDDDTAARLRESLTRFIDARKELTAQVEAGRADVVNIPVRFHVINRGTGVNNGDVPDSVLRQQIDVLNTTFSGGTGGANTSFRFVLAAVDRTTRPEWFEMRFTTPASKEEVDAKAALNTGDRKVLNIYTVNPRGPTDKYTFGWARFPWEGLEIDGVVLNFQSLPGSSVFPEYNRGYTATHEVGHWLGLFHTFKGGCSQPNDEVGDTPQEKDGAVGCPSGQDSCPANPGRDPVENFLDYSFDTCMNKFTQGQATRMYLMYLQYR